MREERGRGRGKEGRDILGTSLFQCLCRFIRTEEDNDDSTWEHRVAKRYYDKLFKEYCLADMTRYKEGKVNIAHYCVSCFFVFDFLCFFFGCNCEVV